MKKLNWKGWHEYFALFLYFFTSNVYASSVGNLPFNTALDEFKSSFMAAVFDISIVLMMASCLMLAFGEWSDGVKRLVGMLFFLALALAAPTGVMLLFGTGAVC